MGLLSEGSPLSWPETKKLADHVREHGITQFINLYNLLKDRQGDVLKWGDEIEYMLVKFNHEEKKAQLSLRAQDLLPVLQITEKENPEKASSLWRPEFASYMVEGTPGKPYGGLLAHFNVVEANMKNRRKEVSALLEKDEHILSITAFPRLGCEGFCVPEVKPDPVNSASRSLFFPDEAIYLAHPRFRTLTRNIRERRGEKVAINVPIFKDVKTSSSFKEDLSALGNDGEKGKNALPDHIYMDAMGFGMGQCCLQLTFQACNIKEARTLYDQLAPMCPIMLALTAASPIQRGHIADTDCRWNIISSSVDCRTREERGLEPLKTNRFRINKSRYDSIDSYLSPEGDRYNDIPLVIDQEAYQRMRDAGIDHLLAQHIAHLFIRDPVSLFSEKINQNDEEDSDHFENLQSTNWQTMRFKPPPPKSTIGWRVEFRPCEAQITDFENAAYVCFIVLLTRVILTYGLNFLIPISKVDENMQRAQKRDAVLNEKFWFRKDLVAQNSSESVANSIGIEQDEISVEMTIGEIINGKGDEFQGLLPLISSYLSSVEVDADTHCTIHQYLRLIQKRASGELMTIAHWMREFVTKHPDYKGDSIVSEQINYDLLTTMDGIQNETIECPALLDHSRSKTQSSIPDPIRMAENCPSTC
ncbi:Glutamate--cysteine ligase catalytic subunit [Daphnia magna]|uniref:Glutamate--cysteine ligase n=1 Tax=Daphnia magna TaxID=35525 RepID=A0A164QPK4_9CRUS|nr:Glutamate--cysteine ligase catalytic subunit [Daphnia magna]